MNSTEISIEKNFEERIKPLMDERVTLIQHAIYSTFIGEGNPDEITIVAILAKLIVLAQRPITFVILKKEKDGYTEFFRTDKYSKDQHKIDSCVEAVKNNSQNNLFQLFGGQYYLLAIIIRKGRGEGFEKNKNIPLKHLFEIVRKSDDIPKTHLDILAYQLTQVLSVDNYFNTSETERKKIFSQLINTSCGQLSLLKEHKSPQETDNSIDCKVDDELKRFRNYLLHEKTGQNPNLKGYGYLDATFQKIKGNLSHLVRLYRTELVTSENQTQSPTTNYLLITRDYVNVENDYKRFNDFNFNFQSRLMICDTQKVEIQYFFIKLRELELNKKKSDGKKYCIPTFYIDSLNDYYRDMTSDITAKFCDEDKERYTYHQYIKPIVEYLNKWFWGVLLKNIKKGEDLNKYIDTNLLGILEQSFGQDARSVADLVFINQLPQIISPYDDAGIPRCFPITTDPSLFETLIESFKAGQLNDSNNYIDLKRLVVTFYWYRGMLESDDDSSSDGDNRTQRNQQMKLILLPVELGGKVWCVQGYFLHVAKNESRKEIDLEESERSWHQIYHLYHDVNSRVKKDIRSNLEACYIQHVTQTYISQLSKPFKDSVRKWVQEN